MKNSRLILFSLHLYLLSGIGLVLCAQDSRFFMETDRTEIAEGETFILDIVLENMNGKNLQLPDLAPFRVVQGPSTSSMVNVPEPSLINTYCWLLKKVNLLSVRLLSNQMVKPSNPILYPLM